MNLLLEHFGGHHPRVRAGWVEVCRPGKDDGVVGDRRRARRRRRQGVVVELAGTAGRRLRRCTSCASWPASPNRRCTSPAIEPPDGLPLVATRRRRPRRARRSAPDAYHGPVGDYLTLVDERTEAHPAPIGFTVLAYLGVLARARHRATPPGGDPPPPDPVGRTRRPDGVGRQGDVGRRRRRAAARRHRPDARRRALDRRGSARGQALVDTVCDRRRRASRRKASSSTTHELAPVFRSCATVRARRCRRRCARRSTASRSRTAPAATASSSPPSYLLGAIGSITADRAAPAARRRRRSERARQPLPVPVVASSATPLPFGANIDDVVGSAAIADAIARHASARRRSSASYRDHAPTRRSASVWEPFYRRAPHGRRRAASVQGAHRPPARSTPPGSPTVYAALDGAADARRRARRGGDRLVRLRARHRRAACSATASPATPASCSTAIRQAGVDGLDGTAQRDVFGRHLDADELDALRRRARAPRGSIHTVDVPTAGRPRRLVVRHHTRRRSPMHRDSRPCDTHLRPRANR